MERYDLHEWPGPDWLPNLPTMRTNVCADVCAYRQDIGLLYNCVETCYYLDVMRGIANG